jgi:hypothetical protein
MAPVDNLTQHILYCGSQDRDFRLNWSQVYQRCGVTLATIAEHLPQIVAPLGPEWSSFTGGTICLANSILSTIPNQDFSILPPTEAWMKRMQHQRLRLLADHWFSLLSRRVNQWSAGPISCFYGGTKSLESINARMNPNCITELSRIDFWDSVRFRIVVPNLSALVIVARNFIEDMRQSLVRCRNYFKVPRRGPMDPYRAIHIEIQSDDLDFVEVQILTARREAVGQIDHPLVHKKKLAFANKWHEAWLHLLSWFANIFDVRDDC